MNKKYNFFSVYLINFLDEILYRRTESIKIAIYRSIGSIASIVSFFIPIKIILLLESPRILDLVNSSVSYDITQELIVISLIVIFFISIFISILSKYFALKSLKNIKIGLWKNYNEKENKLFNKPTFLKFHTKALALLSSVVSFLILITLIFFIDYKVAFFILCCFIIFYIGFYIIINYQTKFMEVSSILFYCANVISFFMTFVFLLVMYSVYHNMELLNMILGFMLSRLIFRNIQDFFQHSLFIYKEIYR